MEDERSCVFKKLCVCVQGAVCGRRKKLCAQEAVCVCKELCMEDERSCVFKKLCVCAVARRMPVLLRAL